MTAASELETPVTLCLAKTLNCCLSIKQAVEEQIQHFGQTPSQLFRRRHPKRGPPPPPAAAPLLNAPDAMKLAAVGVPTAKRCA